jgi:hypothetical protein
MYLTHLSLIGEGSNLPQSIVDFPLVHRDCVIPLACLLALARVRWLGVPLHVPSHILACDTFVT